ncbi:hypothetical protein [Bifidobacterium vansinderenii]|uniref:Uncharacterized protein n=1 Tax=Bifidobacterium vansinderenii TaxID=1984871 RepID=A0A229W0P5_9BIFI|nr:hypothetical protein [Bifidobacterium vansinderenii]OXN01447.1 hypothetical protein Tam10B_0450 [Bifidobacterium vansinderenii]
MRDKILAGIAACVTPLLFLATILLDGIPCTVSMVLCLAAAMIVIDRSGLLDRLVDSL